MRGETMEISPIHAFSGTLAVVIGGAAIIWTRASLANIENKRFKKFSSYFLFGLVALLISNLYHITREVVDISIYFGKFVKLPEFLFLLLGYIILIKGIMAISENSQKRVD